MMNIVHLTSVHPPFDTRIFNKECRTLVRSSFHLSLIAPHDKNETVEGIRIVGIFRHKNRLKRIVYGLIQIYRYLKKINGDLYHFHDPELILIGLYLIKKGKIVVYDAHEDLPRSLFAKSRDYIPQKLKKPVSVAVEIFENFAAQKFSAIVAATPAIGKRFIKLNPNTIVLNNYPLADELWQNTKSSWNHRSMSVSYVGSISRERGLFQMIEAMSHLTKNSNPKLNLAGYISSNDESACSAVPGWDNTQSLGYLNRSEVSNLLSDTRAGLLLFLPDPNHKNAQPNKLFEYMSAGIPVIASNFPLWSRMINKFQCGITVDPTNPKKIARAIEYIFSHSEVAEEMGLNGRKAVEEKFNWAAEENTLLALYKELLAAGYHSTA